MSKHLLQSVADLATANERISELEAALESANEELRSLREAPAPVDGHELASVISRGLVKAKDELIEGFTGKFAVQLLDSTGMVKQGVKENREQLERAEQKTEALEERLRTVYAEISGKLEEALNKLNGAFKTHHATSRAILDKFIERANDCNSAAMEISQTVKICENFKPDYEATVTRAKYVMNHAADTAGDAVAQLREVINSTKTESLELQRTERMLFISVGLAIGLLIGFVMTVLLVFLARAR